MSWCLCGTDPFSPNMTHAGSSQQLSSGTRRHPDWFLILPLYIPDPYECHFAPLQAQKLQQELSAVSGYGAASTAAGGPQGSRRATARSAASFASRAHSLAPSGKQGQQRQLGGAGGGGMPQGLNALRHMAARQAAGQGASGITGKEKPSAYTTNSRLALSASRMLVAQLLLKPLITVTGQRLPPRAHRHVFRRIPFAANHRRPFLLRPLRWRLLLRNPHRGCLRFRPPQPKCRLA